MKSSNEAHDESVHRKRGWLKNLIAIIIGIIAGLFLRVVIGIPLQLIFRSEYELLPSDIRLIFETFVAFVAGAMAGSLVPRFGWLIGAFTQFLQIIATLALLGFWIFFVVTGQEVYALMDLLRSPLTRIMIFAIVIAAVGGVLGRKYRYKIWSFLKCVFGFFGFILSFLAYATSSIIYLYSYIVQERRYLKKVLS